MSTKPREESDKMFPKAEFVKKVKKPPWGDGKKASKVVKTIIDIVERNEYNIIDTLCARCAYAYRD